MSQAAFGEEYEIGNQSMVSQYLLGRRPLNIEAASKFARGLGIKIADFSPSIAQKVSLASTTLDDTGALPASPPAMKANCTIRSYEAGGAMGKSGVVLPDQPGVITRWDVSKKWLNENVRSHSGAANLCIVTGFGDSMQPMFNPGDPLLVDIGINTVEFDSVYFFRIGNDGYVKRLQRIPTEGGLVIRAISENKSAYEPFNITQKMDFHVLGRVLKVWRSQEF